MFSVECRCRRVCDYTTLPPLRGTQRIDPNKQIRGSGLRDVLRPVFFLAERGMRAGQSGSFDPLTPKGRRMIGNRQEGQTYELFMRPLGFADALRTILRVCSVSVFCFSASLQFYFLWVWQVRRSWF